MIRRGDPGPSPYTLEPMLASMVTARRNKLYPFMGLCSFPGDQSALVMVMVTVPIAWLVKGEVGAPVTFTLKFSDSAVPLVKGSAAFTALSISASCSPLLVSTFTLMPVASVTELEAYAADALIALLE